MQRDLIDDCVRCGFCLPHCPTYQSWGEEMDSPRGRIDLMKGLRDGNIPLTDAVVGHFDKCLGCMACMTACPSGVKYDVLIEITRAKVEQEHPRSFAERLFRGVVFAMFPYPRRLKVAVLFLSLYRALGIEWLVQRSGILRVLPKPIARLLSMAPPVEARSVARALPDRVAAQGERRGRVALVTGCVQSVFFPRVNEATLRVLSAEGMEVVAPHGQGCCGALSMHAGREQESLGFARRLIEKLEVERPEAILTNAAGCGSHLKDYGRLFANDPAWVARAKAFSEKVKDINEYLASLSPRAKRHPIGLTVAVHDACHLAHAQRIRSQPRALLSAIPGLKLVEIPNGQDCCGSAGIYNLVQPDSADEIGTRKIANVLATEADHVASANPGCTLHMERLLRARGHRIRALHPIEILDASIRGEDLG